MIEPAKKLKIDNGFYVNLTITYDSDSVILYQNNREVVTSVEVLEKIIALVKSGAEHEG